MSRSREAPMADRSVLHTTLVVERRYAAAPARVFAAWSDAARKRLWFTEAGDTYALDFRIGGQETSSGTEANGQSFRYEARYYDIVAPERIVYSYEMYTGAERISVSLTTIELLADGTGTRLICTEQAAFLDGRDTPGQRSGGIGSLLDRLGDVLEAKATP
jgi:uncharacterized protein YndB with AHSA1/START domain